MTYPRNITQRFFADEEKAFLRNLIERLRKCEFNVVVLGLQNARKTTLISEEKHQFSIENVVYNTDSSKMDNLTVQKGIY